MHRTSVSMSETFLQGLQLQGQGVLPGTRWTRHSHGTLTMTLHASRCASPLVQSGPHVQSAKPRDVGGLEVPAGPHDRRRGQKQHKHQPGSQRTKLTTSFAKIHRGPMPGDALRVVEPCTIALQTGLSKRGMAQAAKGKDGEGSQPTAAADASSSTSSRHPLLRKPPSGLQQVQPRRRISCKALKAEAGTGQAHLGWRAEG